MRLVESDGRAARAFAWMRAGIEAARPTPRVFVMWAPAADRNRSDVYVTVIDVPAFLAGIGRSAAGEGRHVPITPPI
jgi:hypothetical protein